MTTIHIDYPIKMTIETRKIFFDDKERTTYIRRRLSKIDYDSFHHYSEFVVEESHSIAGNHEFWVIGS